MHSGDESQLEVIFSNEKRLIVEAPAGYGKTRTMISKIAYMLATNQLIRPKKILALTFSVNAAFKIKKEVFNYLPMLFTQSGIEYHFIDDYIFVSNYHQFCRHVLSLYGYLIHPNLKNIKYFSSIDDSDIQDLYNLKIGLTFDELNMITDFNRAVKEINTQFLNKNFIKYNDLILTYFVPHNYITYNGILTLTYQLFKIYPKILNFYQKYYPIIIIDEFQDTNILHWYLLNLLITDNTQLIFMGDSLQRIYGFIGAIPKLLDLAESTFKMTKIRLKKNHRFKDNPQMLLLERNIRLNAENPSNPQISKNIKINHSLLPDQKSEALWLVEEIKTLLNCEPNAQIAILVKQRNENVAKILDELSTNKVDYFYGLFRDEDPIYIEFHRKCLEHFISLLKKNDRINKPFIRTLHRNIKNDLEKENPLNYSLLELLEIFCNKIFIDYSFLDNEEKISLILDTFEHRTLKHYMENINKKVIVSTVHGAKGLEWDYVFIPDMEKFSFPNYYGLCGICRCATSCNLQVTSEIESKFLEELSTFYVAVTRARKTVFFSSSSTRINNSGNEEPTNVSCFLKLPGFILP